ncbi:MAG TPA: choice-of-anchor X domain-containing protein [Pyrinomonadaceae bacterium]|nr:choice-of-anchor X domain-containing protein [Pyrinomonadaceae bacterium]
MRLSKIYRVKLLAMSLVAAFLCVTLIGGSGFGQRQARPDRTQPDDKTRLFGSELDVDPPDVEAIYVKLLEKPTSEGNALLKVIYVKSEQSRIGRQVPIQLEKRRIVLRDDGEAGDEKAGDGVYSAVIDFDFAEFEQQQRRLQDVKDKEQLVVPIFKGRERVSEERAQILDLRKLRVGQEIKIFPFFPPLIDPKRSLMITDPSVVKDPARTFNPCTNTGTPMGKWTFGRLMREMANQPSTGVNPSTFVRNWLREWVTNQSINGFTVQNRAAQMLAQILGPWQAQSGGPNLNLARAPFILVAIVNRVDLRTNPVYGGTGGNAGEARFVFGAVGPNCQMLPFTVIFEYGVPKKGCPAVKLWGQQWANLSTLPLGSPAYLAALENITDQFSLANANPAKPNGSALNQLRTNEIALSFPWELREFVIKPSHQLEEDTVKQTPDLTRNNTPTLANFINPRTAAILANNYVVPNTFPGVTPFLGGSALTPSGGAGGTHWNAAGILNLNARHIFSLNTCNGCHAGETATRFLHVDPQVSPAGLSGFLTGETIPDVVQGPVVMHNFNDLARRAVDLSTLVNSPCFFQLGFETLRMTH